jgi:hypothetical protein
MPRRVARAAGREDGDTRRGHLQHRCPAPRDDDRGAGGRHHRAAAAEPPSYRPRDRSMSPDPAARYRDGAEPAAVLAGAMEQAPPLADAKRPPLLVVLDFICTSGGDGWLGTAIGEGVAASLSRLDAVSVATRRRNFEVGARDGAGTVHATAAVDCGRAVAARWVISVTYAQSGVTRAGPREGGVHVPCEWMSRLHPSRARPVA